MSAPGRTEAIQAIEACEGLTEQQIEEASVLAMRDIIVAQGIVATPPDERAEAIRRLPVVARQIAHTR